MTITAHAPLAPAVRRVMRHGVICMPEDAPLAHVQRAMAQHGVHAVLVVSSGPGRPLGWVTAKGLMPYVGEDLVGLRATLAISEAPARIAPGASIVEAARRLAEPGVTRLLVCDGPTAPPLGVLTDLDVLRAAA